MRYLFMPGKLGYILETIFSTTSTHKSGTTSMTRNSHWEQLRFHFGHLNIVEDQDISIWNPSRRYWKWTCSLFGWQNLIEKEQVINTFSSTPSHTYNHTYTHTQTEKEGAKLTDQQYQTFEEILIDQLPRSILQKEVRYDLLDSSIRKPQSRLYLRMSRARIRVFLMHSSSHIFLLSCLYLFLCTLFCAELNTHKWMPSLQRNCLNGFHEYR